MSGKATQMVAMKHRYRRVNKQLSSPMSIGKHRLGSAFSRSVAPATISGQNSPLPNTFLHKFCPFAILLNSKRGSGESVAMRREGKPEVKGLSRHNK